jgi:hypothetical protein
MQTYRQPPLPPASVFALPGKNEDTATTVYVPVLPSPALLEIMAEHRSRYADAFQWKPLLLAGMPYAPRRDELHPYGIQARLSGEAMGAEPVTGHTPQVFAKRAQLGEFLQLLGAHAQLSRDADSAGSPTASKVTAYAASDNRR